MTDETLDRLQAVLDLWDLGVIRTVATGNIPMVTRTMIDFRKALQEEHALLEARTAPKCLAKETV